MVSTTGNTNRRIRFEILISFVFSFIGAAGGEDEEAAANTGQEDQGTKREGRRGVAEVPGVQSQEEAVQRQKSWQRQQQGPPRTRDQEEEQKQLIAQQPIQERPSKQEISQGTPRGEKETVKHVFKASPEKQSDSIDPDFDIVKKQV